MDRSPGGPGGSSGSTDNPTSKKIPFLYHSHYIILNKIDVNLTEKSLDLVDFVNFADAPQGGRGYYPTPYWRTLLISLMVFKM